MIGNQESCDPNSSRVSSICGLSADILVSSGSFSVFSPALKENGVDEIYKRDVVRDIVMSWYSVFNAKSQ